MTQAVARGLQDIVVSQSRICYIDGNAGKLYYRGYNINDLAGKSNFEETSYLLVYGALPTKEQFSAFSKKLGSSRNLPNQLMDMMHSFCKIASPMDALRSAISLLGCFDRDTRDSSIDAVREKGINLIAKFPTLVAAYDRIRKGQEPVEPNPRLSHAANFLYMLQNKPPNEDKYRAVDLDFLLHAEHDFNASTFAARVTVSTLADIYSAVISAVGTLKGPLHGGAAQAVLKMLKTIGDMQNVEHYVSDTLSRHGKIMGFGHRVYKTMDPRAVILKKIAEDLGAQYGQSKWLQMSKRIEQTMMKERALNPNVDFYSPSVYSPLDIEEDLFDPIFAIGRISGWVAHILEQLSDNKLIRPRTEYLGQLDLPYVPINERK